MEKQIVICIGTDRSDNIRARLSLIVKEGQAVLSEIYHSLSITPGCDLLGLRAAVEQQLNAEGSGIPGTPWGNIPDAEWLKVQGIVAVLHTPEVVLAYQSRIAAIS